MSKEFSTFADGSDCKECAALERKITTLTARLAAAEALLTTACDAWECGQMVWNQEGHLLADYKAVFLPKDWYDKARGG